MQMKKINSGKLRAIGYDGREIKGEPLAKLRTRVELTAKWGAKEIEAGGHCWQDGGSKDYIDARYEYYATKRNNATLANNSAGADAGITKCNRCADTEA